MKNDFSKGSVGKHILMQAIPLTIAQLIQLLYSVVDRMYIGHLPGAHGHALTGIGLVFPIITIISAFTNLFASGGAPLFSIARGEGKEKRASRIMNNAFFMLCLTGIFLMVICYLFEKPILYLFGASDVTYSYAKEYLMIYLLGTIFVMISTGMNQFINAQGFPKIGMTVVMLGAVLNLILDPVFIFVLNLGIRGAAIATVISQFASFSLVMSFFFGKKTLYRLKWEDMKPELPLIRKIIGLGTSGFIMAVTNSLVQIVCNVTLKSYGGDLYIGVMTILNSVREIANIVVVGITSGAQPVIGYNYGAKAYQRVKKAIVITSLIGIVYTTLVWAFVMLEPGVFIKLFSDSKAMEAPAREALKLYFFGFFFMAFQFAGQSTFVALGKAKFSIFFSLFRKVIIVVPLTIFLPRLWGLGVDGVYLAEPISNAIGGLACFITMICVVWKELSDKNVNGVCVYDEKK